MNDFNEPGSLAPTGLFLGGTKYMVIQGEPGAVIRGKKVYHISFIFHPQPSASCRNKIKILRLAFYSLSIQYTRFWCNFTLVVTDYITTVSVGMVSFRDLAVLLSRKQIWLWSLAFMMSQWLRVSATWLLRGSVIISSNKAFRCGVVPLFFIWVWCGPLLFNARKE